MRTSLRSVVVARQSSRCDLADHVVHIPRSDTCRAVLVSPPFATLTAMSSAIEYPQAAGCSATLDAWCQNNCPHASAHHLYARHDTNHYGHTPVWRCYAEETLDSSMLKYSHGETFCTRHAMLIQLLKKCVEDRRDPKSSNYDSEDAYGPMADEVQKNAKEWSQHSAKMRTAQAERKETPAPTALRHPSDGGATSRPAPGRTPPATQISPSSSLASPTFPAARTDGTCSDASFECAVWAQYDECRQNAAYMHEACPVSCRKCSAASVATPSKPPPSPSVPHPSPPPPTGRPAATGGTCAHACDARDGPPCTGRGHCSEWGERQWCVCHPTSDVRYTGLRCEKPIGQGIACASGCNAHGTCVHGYCECDYGWRGDACDEEAMPDPFLSISRLHAAGLVAGRPGSKINAEKACASPTLHTAYARDAEKMKKLLASLKEGPSELKCDTCAIVSNAGGLLESEHGAAIDSNECVWRMNRAPTAGFEAHVGSKTTLDWVNSFPHLRDTRILPRIDNALLHGMTVEVFDPRPGQQDGFSKYMAWLSGHVDFSNKNPMHETYVVDLEWLASSWEAYWAYLAPWLPPNTMQGQSARPSSGWHVTRMALSRCAKVRLYGFSMAASKFHYFDSLVQETVRPAERDPRAGTTHKFAWEHEVFMNWTKTLPAGRLELIR